MGVAARLQQRMEEAIDREQAFRILRTAGFMLDHVGGDRWQIGVAFPEAQGTPLDGQVYDEHWITGFAERFYHAYLEFICRKAASIMRDCRAEE